MQPLDLWPTAARRELAGVFTDIDDTLTTEGAITPDALQALADLKAAGLLVIPITGRPIGWCEPFMAGARRRDPACGCHGGRERGRGIYPRRWRSTTAGQALPARHRRHTQRQPGADAKSLPWWRLKCPVWPEPRQRWAQTDLAFDYAEFDQHPPETVQQVLACCSAKACRPR